MSLTWGPAAQAAAASAQQQMEQVALLPRMMAMAHVMAANDAQQRQALYAPPAPQPGTLPECAPLVTADAQLAVQQQQQQQQQQKQQCAEQLMALLAAGSKPLEGPPASQHTMLCLPQLRRFSPSYRLDDNSDEVHGAWFAGDQNGEKSDISANAMKGQSAFGPCQSTKPNAVLANGPTNVV